MPTYTFMNLESGIEYDETMPMSEYDEYMKNNNVQRVYQPIALSADHLMGVGPKNDEGFKERMSQIASAHPNSPLGDKYKTGESHKALKTKEVIRKHQKKKPLVTK